MIETPEHRILIDPDKKCPERDADYVLISHPHADHYSGAWKLPYNRKVMNILTYEVITFRNPRKTMPNVQFIADTLSLNGVKVRTYPAGHTIGSVQFEMDFGDISIGYTGDFCLQSRLGIEKCEVIPHPDVLIIESTYGSEEYQFPNRGSLYKDMITWIANVHRNGACLVISARPVGTAQEITKLLNVAREALDVYVHPTIFHLNGIFKKYSQIGNARGRLFPDVANLPNATFLTPLWGNLDSDEENLAICSGWLLDDERDTAFPISNHAGFNQILAYINASKPKKILTVYGNSESMAMYLRRQGYDAESL